MLRFIYQYIFFYVLCPAFVLIFLGKPRILVKLVHKIIHLKEPFRGFRMFNVFTLLCLLFTVFNYFRVRKDKYELHEFGSLSHDLMDKKLREINLHERNTYMFFAFFIMCISVERIVENYFKLWSLEDEKKHGKKNNVKIETPK
jgi:hypothetical protein